MHDIDRVLFEITGDESGEGGTYEEAGVFGEEETEQETYATYGEEPGEGEIYWAAGEQEVGDSPAQEIALATELLDVTTEEELDQFLGNVVRSIGSAASNLARSGAGRAVTGILKDAARQGLSQIGGAVGGWIAPGAGGDIGRRVGGWLGRQFELGLQTEGLSPEDREFQTARTFVRFATDAARRVAQTPTSVPPGVAAQRAVVAAARRYLPGLMRPPSSTGAPGPVPLPSWSYAGESEQETETGLAYELLGVTTEDELDQFLGKLAGKVLSRLPLGKTVVYAVKNVAKRALPIAGGALGNVVAPGVGGVIGSKLGSVAGGLLESGEAEVLGDEAEQEAARRYVRFARAAFRNAARAPRSVPPRAAARAALVGAARVHAPSLLVDRRGGWRSRRRANVGQPIVAYQPGVGFADGAGDGDGQYGSEGRWVRHGDRVVLTGL